VDEGDAGHGRDQQAKVLVLAKRILAHMPSAAYKTQRNNPDQAPGRRQNQKYDKARRAW
jgi:hypothetical protein